jgi:hypothetical protein
MERAANDHRLWEHLPVMGQFITGESLAWQTDSRAARLGAEQRPRPWDIATRWLRFGVHSQQLFGIVERDALGGEKALSLPHLIQISGAEARDGTDNRHHHEQRPQRKSKPAAGECGNDLVPLNSIADLAVPSFR